MCEIKSYVPDSNQTFAFTVFVLKNRGGKRQNNTEVKKENSSEIIFCDFFM